MNNSSFQDFGLTTISDGGSAGLALKKRDIDVGATGFWNGLFTKSRTPAEVRPESRKAMDQLVSQIRVINMLNRN